MKELTSTDLHLIIANPNAPHVKVDSHAILYEAYEFGGQTWVFRVSDPDRVFPQLIALCPSPLDALGIIEADWRELGMTVSESREEAARIGQADDPAN